MVSIQAFPYILNPEPQASALEDRLLGLDGAEGRCILTSLVGIIASARLWVQGFGFGLGFRIQGTSLSFNYKASKGHRDSDVGVVDQEGQATLEPKASRLIHNSLKPSHPRCRQAY